jgi:very-short-patch-repair endonuclease
MPRSKQSRNVGKARTLRANMSLPEVLLWQQLRQQTDVKFRRQHPLGRYVLDFYCAKAKLCIEVDGIGHEMGDRPQRDEMRDKWLASQGIMVTRIPAREVLMSPDKVAENLLRYCKR